MHYANHVKIVYEESEVYEDDFNEESHLEWYTLIDNELMARDIKDEIEKEVGKKILLDNGKYDDKIIYEKIDGITEAIKNRLYNYVCELIDNNICDWEN